jgi:hypothetical protein
MRRFRRELQRCHPAAVEIEAKGRRQALSCPPGAENQPLHCPRFFRSLTPGPLPLSSMKITQEVSRMARAAQNCDGKIHIESPQEAVTKSSHQLLSVRLDLPRPSNSE